MRTPNALSTVALATLIAACAPSPSDLKHHEAVAEDALTSCAGGTTLQGLDVSVYQGSIDWNAVAGAGISFAYAKATEGTGYDDTTFAANWSGMQAHGVARGAYHFFHPDLSGTQQADHFLAAVGALGAGDLPPMLDWEVSEGASEATASANAQAFINEIAAKTGRQTVIYTSPGIWSGFGSPGGFGGDGLWVADWGPTCPSLPGGWGSWVFWQYSDDGTVAGVPARVDRDVFNGDAAALSGLAGGSAAACSAPIAIGHGLGAAGPISGAACGGTAPVPTAPTACGSIPSGQGLSMGQSVTSCDGRFEFVMQGDGNLVEYVAGNALFNTGTVGTAAALVMQGDGNLVLYSSTGCAVWASNTAGHPGASLAVQTDANLVIYDASGAPLWSSGSGPIAAAVTDCGAMAPGTALARGESVDACGGCFTFVMQGDGNLVMYQKGGGAIWNSHTAGTNGYAATMQGDGNLVIYSSDGCPLWNSQSGGHPGASLAVQDDGNLVIYEPGGGVAWDAASVACAGGCTCNAPPPPPATTATATAASTATATSAAATTTGATTSSGSTATATASSTTSSSGGTSGSAHGTTTGGASGSTGSTHGSSSGSTGSGTRTNAASTATSTTAASSSGSTGHSSSGSTEGTTGSTGGTTGEPEPKGGCSSTQGADLAPFALALLALATRRRQS